jgi:hypothetical protein
VRAYFLERIVVGVDPFALLYGIGDA